MKDRFLLFISICALFIVSCNEEMKKETTSPPLVKSTKKIELDINEANRLSELPLGCIQNPLPYKSGLVIAKKGDLAMPIAHHPAFYGCFDWHSAVHGHWSLVYLLKNFPDLANKEQAIRMLNENLTAENIEKEVAYFALNRESKSFERTYGWAWLLKLQEELFTWNNPLAQRWYTNLKPLEDYISNAYIDYLPKLVYPIRVGTHSNTAFGMSFAYDYAQAVGNDALSNTIKEAAIRFYSNDKDCPIHWEPSGYDFLSPCLQELDVMRKVLSEEEFNKWSVAFLPPLFNQNLSLDPGQVRDRSDGHLVHLDGVNFSRAWCLYPLKDNVSAYNLATEHLDYSLSKITDGDYAGQHWLGSFALYAFKTKIEAEQ
ncbi:MAG: DUF2891 domain-containing protein [Bacteroidota bacterium]